MAKDPIISITKDEVIDRLIEDIDRESIVEAASERYSASEIAEEFDVEDVAKEIDLAELASHIEVGDLAVAMVNALNPPVDIDTRIKEAVEPQLQVRDSRLDTLSSQHTTMAHLAEGRHDYLLAEVNKLQAVNLNMVNGLTKLHEANTALMERITELEHRFVALNDIFRSASF